MTTVAGSGTGIAAGAGTAAGAGSAETVLLPESVDEVVGMVAAAAETGTRLLPAGNRSWLGAGGWGREPRTIVSTARMDAVVDYEPADLTLTAESGLGMRALRRLLDRHGQWLPLNPPGRDDGTFGAAVACGVSGPLQGSYGGVRDNVLGLEVVTGDGRVLRIGGRVVKNVAGYDMVRLFTGSRGSLGVITRVSVRLFPRPEAEATLHFRGSVAEVVGMARAVCTAGFPVASVEIFGGGADGAEMVLSVRLLGGEEEVEEARARTVASVGRRPHEVLGGADSASLHRGRLAWEAGAAVVARLAALPDRLGDTMARAVEVAAPMRGEVAADAMRGLVRVKGGGAPGRMAAVADCVARARAAMVDRGGSLALSTAPREVGAGVGWVGERGGAGGLNRRIKALFDPHSVLASEAP